MLFIDFWDACTHLNTLIIDCNIPHQNPHHTYFRALLCTIEMRDFVRNHWFPIDGNTRLQHLTQIQIPDQLWENRLRRIRKLKKKEFFF